MSDLPTPINRNEQYLNAIANGDPSDLPTPITREEQYLDYIAKHSGGGDAGVSSVNGKTGAVTLDASDVGALPADTPIPSKTSDLDNDSGFVPADSALSTTSENALQNKVITSNILAIENVTGAKNLNSYPYYETTKTENGITFTDNGDGTITIGTGTASADTFFMYHESYENLRLSKNGQQYTLSGCPVGGGSSSYSLFFNYKIDDNTWGNAVYDNGDGVDISYSYTGSSSGGIYYGGIQIKSGTVISTPITFKPMIRPAGTDPTYVPYAMTNRELTERVEYEGDGVSAIKAGYTVTVSVAKTTTNFSLGWNVLDTLPSAFCPQKIIRFNGIDDNSTSWSESLCIPLMINTSGEVKMWGFNAHLSASPVGCITYIV